MAGAAPAGSKGADRLGLHFRPDQRRLIRDTGSETRVIDYRTAHVTFDPCA
jgi:hypothetical protein